MDSNLKVNHFTGAKLLSFSLFKYVSDISGMIIYLKKMHSSFLDSSAFDELCRIGRLT
jgi:hypothetical protein